MDWRQSAKAVDPTAAGAGAGVASSSGGGGSKIMGGVGMCGGGMARCSGGGGAAVGGAEERDFYRFTQFRRRGGTFTVLQESFG